jgi:hypothetical protein
MSDSTNSGPPLSATTDMPQAPPSLASSETDDRPGTSNAETGEAAAEASAPKPAATAPDSTSDSDPVRDALSELSALSARAANIKDPGAPAPRPARAQFSSPEDYDSALIQWSGAHEARKVAAKVERENVANAAQPVRERLARSLAERRAQAIKEFPDFVEIAERDNLPVTPAMAEAIVSLPAGLSIAYHLGKNPAIAARISKLSPAVQVVEITKLSAKLAQSKPAGTSAPRAKAASSPSKPSVRQLSEMSMADYAAHRARRSGAR